MWLLGLFKSNQEYQFYRAVREVFQMFLVFPNVALNSVISYDLIKSKLTAEEKKHFWAYLILIYGSCKITLESYFLNWTVHITIQKHKS